MSTYLNEFKFSRTVNNINDLDDIKNPQIGELVMVLDENKLFTCADISDRFPKPLWISISDETISPEYNLSIHLKRLLRLLQHNIDYEKFSKITGICTKRIEEIEYIHNLTKTEYIAIRTVFDSIHDKIFNYIVFLLLDTDIRKYPEYNIVCQAIDNLGEILSYSKAYIFGERYTKDIIIELCKNIVNDTSSIEYILNSIIYERVDWLYNLNKSCFCRK